MSETSRRLTRAVTSARLAAWLIGVLVGLILLAYSVPQRGIFPDEQVEAFLADVPGVIAWFVRSLGMDHVFTSTLFYVVVVILAVNLMACTVQRVVRRRKRSRSTGAGAVPDTATTVTASDPIAVEEVLASLGMQATLVSETERRYYLRRGDYGFAGSIVMHAALVLVLLAGVLTGLTTFTGEMVLTEGQTVVDSPSEYLSVTQVPLLGRGFAEFAVTLEDMEFTYEQGAVTDAVATLRVDDAKGSRLSRARVNYPLKAHGKSFLLQDAGHSVWITVNDAAGAEVFSSFLNLADVSDIGYQDSLTVGDVQLYLASRPSMSQPVEEPVATALALERPIVGLSLDRISSAADCIWVEPGSPPVALDGYSVTVHEVRIWNRFLVRADGGRGPMYAAFVLVILGAVARFVDPDRWLKCSVEDSSAGVVLMMWGAERYRAGLPREGRRVLARLSVTDKEAHGDR